MDIRCEIVARVDTRLDTHRRKGKQNIEEKKK